MKITSLKNLIYFQRAFYYHANIATVFQTIHQPRLQREPANPALEEMSGKNFQRHASEFTR